MRKTERLINICIDSSICDACGRCVSVCPKNVLCIKSRFSVSVANEEDCIGCLSCEGACPNEAIKVENRSIKKFFISKLCNNSCLMCFEHDVNIDSDYSTEFLMDKFEDEITGSEKMIVLSGAEITTRKDLFKLLKKIKERNENCQVFLPTNGRMFSYMEYVKRLKAVGIKDLKITVSILGSDEQVHDSITQVQGSFSQTEKGILNLLKYFDNVNINVTVQKKNVHQIESIVNKFLPMGIRTIQFALVEPNGKAAKDFEDFLPDIFDYSDELERILEKSDGRVKVKNFPLCALRNQHDKSFFSTQNHLKLKIDSCQDCVLNKECNGLWEEYVRIFGDSRITPFRLEDLR